MKKKNFSESLVFYCTTYQYGILSGLIVLYLRILRVFIIKYLQRMPKWQENMIIMPNHPTMLEPFIVPPALSFLEYLVNPDKWGPVSTPDTKNFGNWFFIKPWAIAVDRSHPGNGKKALLEMISALKEGKRLIIFPEGGRTTGKTVNAGQFVYSAKGHKIKKLQTGIYLLIKKANPLILPVWISGTEKVLLNRTEEVANFSFIKKFLFFFPRFWRKIEIKVGEPFRIDPATPKKEVMENLTSVLLNLADE